MLSEVPVSETETALEAHEPTGLNYAYPNQTAPDLGADEFPNLSRRRDARRIARAGDTARLD